MFIQKVSRLSHFLRVWLQSLKKILKWPNFFKIIIKDIKNADLKSIKKVFKKFTKKKVLAKMWRKYALFPLLLMFVKIVLLITFLCAFFKNFFNRFVISMKFCVFWHLFLIKKKNLGQISTFLNFETKLRKKRRQKSKNVLSKCVLDFKFCTHQRVCVLNLFF